MKKRVVKRRKPALVSHHSTTGKRLTREYTSYPLVVFILLVMGLFMGGLTFKANAADVAINATVLGQPPTIPATIVTPTDGTHFTSLPITVVGTCGPGDVIKLYRNTVFSGSVICAGDSTFQIQTSLYDGSNDLQARTFNLADLEGPTSPVVNVVYDAPVIPPSGGGSGTPGGGSTPAGSTPAPSAGGNAPIVPPLLLTVDDTTVRGYYVGDNTEIELVAIGGTGPYNFNISWGDGTTSVVERLTNGKFTVNHVYKHAGTGFGDNFAIRITATDAKGMATFLELTVVVHDKDAIGIALKTQGIDARSGLPALHLPLLLAYVWPAYAVAMLMGVSFWLGQRRILLRVKPKLRHHRL